MQSIWTSSWGSRPNSWGNPLTAISGVVQGVGQVANAVTAPFTAKQQAAAAQYTAMSAQQAAQAQIAVAQQVRAGKTAQAVTLGGFGLLAVIALVSGLVFAVRSR